MEHIVALSGGSDSTALALALQEREPRDYKYICTPTGNELPDMMAHWDRLGKLLGKPLVSLTTNRSLMGLIYEQRALPNWRMRWCTRMLKIEPFEAYVLERSPCVVYVGIRADETHREGVDYNRLDSDVTHRHPLVEWGWTKTNVLRYLKERDVTIPDRTDCAICFFQTLSEWHTLWKDHPELYRQGEAAEFWVGHTLRSPRRDTRPAGLAELRRQFEAGYVPSRRTMSDRKLMCSVCAR